MEDEYKEEETEEKEVDLKRNENYQKNYKEKA